MIFQVKLSGLHCQSCQKLTKMMFSKISGVVSVEVDLNNSEATISSERTISLDELRSSLQGTNYQVVSVEQ